jgi:hypothetical protein
MKQTLLTIFIVLVLLSCKNESKTNESTVGAEGPDKTAKQDDGLTLLKGDFVFYEDAAVLQTHAEFYGVLITDKVHELNDMVEKYKNADTDMVPVEIRGRVSKEKHETILWPNKVEIVEILNVYEPQAETNETIKLGTE